MLEGGPIDAVRSWLTSVRRSGRTLRRDAVAGVPGAIGSIPDGMATGLT